MLNTAFNASYNYVEVARQPPLPMERGPDPSLAPFGPASPQRWNENAGGGKPVSGTQRGGKGIRKAVEKKVPLFFVIWAALLDCFDYCT